MQPTPILILSDAPDCHTGLARITRDLASILVKDPKWRVGTIGLGGHGSRRLPWQQYNIQRLEGEWGQGSLRQSWSDFAGNERGVLFTIWDATRVHWIGQSGYYFQQDPAMREFMNAGHFQKWGYFPVDATGPGDKLTGLAVDSLMGFDRVLGYTKWSSGVLERSLGAENAGKRHLDWIPHGINMGIFKPHDREECRKQLFPSLHDGDILIGINMTNQPRKDWGLGMTVAAKLKEKYKHVYVWAHTDMLDRYWNILALIEDLGLGGSVFITLDQTDEALARRYSACNLTMLPSLGEGFGYPLFESLACGVPVLHGDYAGGADIMQQCGWGQMLIYPEAYRLDTMHNCVRPVHSPMEWVRVAEKAIIGLDTTFNGDGVESEKLRSSVAHLDWKNLSWVWKRWFDEGRAQL